MIRALVVALACLWGAPTWAASDGVVVAKAKSKKGAKAKGKKKGKRKSGGKKKRGPVTVPVDLGVGPAVHLLTGKLQDDQTLHYGLKISLYAVIDQKLIKENIHRVPKKYRKMAAKQEEVRYRPGILALVPDTLFISPKTDQTAMYGANWSLIGIGTSFGKTPRVGIKADLDVAYAYIGSDDPALGTTHFLRPGLGLQLDLEIPFTDSFLMSLGWKSTAYVPQEVGGAVFSWGKAEDNLWHFGQAFLKLHFRFPYTTTL